jgi:hypothetical protein
VLHDGSIAEMKTGEGKTLVSTLSAYLNALTGEGVHGTWFIITCLFDCLTFFEKLEYVTGSYCMLVIKHNFRTRLIYFLVQIFEFMCLGKPKGYWYNKNNNDWQQQ